MMWMMVDLCMFGFDVIVVKVLAERLVLFVFVKLFGVFDWIGMLMVWMVKFDM